jgi:siroheme synthase
MAASFTVLSGHRIPDADHDWEALARSGSTLVVLMGATTAVEVATRLMAEGRPADEPVAAVHRAGTPAMEVATMRLDHLAERGCPFPAPTVLVIGDVAAFAHPATPAMSERPTPFNHWGSVGSPHAALALR